MPLVVMECFKCLPDLPPQPRIPVSGLIFSGWRDRVVPISVERVASQIDRGDLRIGDFDAFGIFVFVELGTHFEAGICCRRGDQLDDRAIAAQRLAAPVDGDERKQTVLDLVPFAGARREVTDRDFQPGFVGQFLVEIIQENVSQ